MKQNYMKQSETKQNETKWLVCRVHAKKIGHSLFGDDAYGGAGGSAVSAVGRGKSLRYARHTKHQHSKAIIMSCLIPERVSATGLDACVNLSYTVSCGVM